VWFQSLIVYSNLIRNISLSIYSDASTTLRCEPSTSCQLTPTSLTGTPCYPSKKRSSTSNDHLSRCYVGNTSLEASLVKILNPHCVSLILFFKMNCTIVLIPHARNFLSPLLYSILDPLCLPLQQHCLLSSIQLHTLFPLPIPIYRHCTRHLEN